MTSANEQTQRIIIDNTNRRLDELRDMVKEVATTTTETRIEVAGIKIQMGGLCTQAQARELLDNHCKDKHSKISHFPRPASNGKLYKLLGRIAAYLAFIGTAIWGVVELFKAAPKP